MKQAKIVFSIMTLFLSLSFGGCSDKNHEENSNKTWEEIAPGIMEKEISTNQKNLLVFTIDPKKYDFQIVQNPSDQTKRQSIKEIHDNHQSKLSFNGNFFSKEFTPTGLLISEHTELYPLIKANLLNGVFLIDEQQIPHLYTYDQIKNSDLLQTAAFAIQSGPILLDPQKNVTLTSESSNKKSSRTSIGITKNNQIIVIILKQTLLNSENALSLLDFANLLQTTPELKDLGLHSVLNLDGGTSTGLATDNNYYPELAKIQNCIITKTR